MKIKDYKPNSEEEAIGWLLEESAEVIVAIGRCMRFGIENVHERRPNREWLMAEIGDLKKAIVEAEVWLDRGKG
jgi:hypothetical protein